MVAIAAKCLGEHLMKVAIALTGIFLSLVALISCTGSAERVAVTRTPEARSTNSPRPDDVAATSREPEQPGKHWVQSQQLSALMNTISATMLADSPEDLPRPRSDQTADDIERSIAAASKLADGLAASAERIPVQVEHVQMSEADRAGFFAEAETLRKQAIGLGEAARARQTDKMQTSLSAISSTCISCHSRYRDFAGELDTQRAGAGDAGQTDLLWSQSLR